MKIYAVMFLVDSLTLKMGGLFTMWVFYQFIAPIIKYKKSKSIKGGA